MQGVSYNDDKYQKMTMSYQHPNLAKRNSAVQDAFEFS